MSDTDRPGTRGQEHVIEIDAPREAVWRAITEAEEVTRWYVESAEIDARLGGTYRVSWGEGMDGESQIVAFEPERRFKLEHRPMPGSSPLPSPITEEYTIETDGGRTVLRLVTSGIPDTEEWDWFYEGTKRGWTIFFLGLRHYLERHAGAPRDQVMSMVGLPGSCEEAWPILMSRDGLGLADTVASANAGDRYAGQTGFGQELRGDLLMLDPPYRLLATVDGLNDALLGATLEQMGEQNVLFLALSTYGLDPAAVDRIRERWEGWLSGLFPGAGSPAEAFQDAFGDLVADAGEPTP